jgi:hypothetical protein
MKPTKHPCLQGEVVWLHLWLVTMDNWLGGSKVLPGYHRLYAERAVCPHHFLILPHSSFLSVSHNTSGTVLGMF